MPSVQVLGKVTTTMDSQQQSEILSPAALAFLSLLQRTFNGRRKDLLHQRQLRQQQIDSGRFPNFLPQTEPVRSDPSWQGAPPAPGLVDRRVEITGVRSFGCSHMSAGRPQQQVSVPQVPSVPGVPVPVPVSVSVSRLADSPLLFAPLSSLPYPRTIPLFPPASHNVAGGPQNGHQRSQLGRHPVHG